jgi:hypothetical protein
MLILLTLWCPSSPYQAQKKVPVADYDYFALTINSIGETTTEASKIPDISQRARVLTDAAKILAPARKEESVRLLEVVLRDLKEWASADSAKWSRRHTAATLRNDALAVYAQVDPETALIRQKEFRALEASTVSTSSAASSPTASLKTDSWFTHFSDRRVVADQAVKVARSIIDTEPEKAVRLITQSLQSGTVSVVIFEIQQQLLQNRNRSLLDTLETRISQVLATSSTLDSTSLVFASTVGLVDKDMPAEAKKGFVTFLMSSLQAWATVVKEPGINTSYITQGFVSLSGSPRQLILQHAPDQLPEFDLLLEQVAPLVPESMRQRMQSFQPEKFTDPKERLDDILRDAVAVRRDLRLVRLVSELLRTESADSQKNLDLAGEAVNGFSDADNKAAFSDLVTTTRVNALVKQKKFIEAQQLAATLPSEEIRAWALLAVAMVATKEDKTLGFESITKALKALDTAEPSPFKAELGLLATAMLVKDDSRRAFETLAIAIKYANSSEPKDPAKMKTPVAFGLKTEIGEMQTKLGVVPMNLSDLTIDPTLSGLATTDWFRADQMVSSIREPSLRLTLKLQFAGAVLARKLKSKTKQTETNFE